MDYKNINTRSRAPIGYYHHKINALNRKLYATNGKAYAYSQGRISEEEYAPIRAEREACRAEINDLAAKIAELKNNA